MARVLQQSTKDEIRRLADAGCTVREISKRLLVGQVAVRNYVREYGREKAGDAPASPPEPQVEAVETRRKFVEDGDKAEVVYSTPHEVRTLEDAIRYAEVDTSIWRVAKWECTSWEVVAKDEQLVESKGKDWKINTPRHHHLWRVHVKLERIAPKAHLDALDALFAKYEDRAPRVHAPVARTGDGKVMLKVCLADVHFGKLAWRAETGQDYDLRLADAIFENAVADIIDETGHLGIEKILLPFGNDFLHTDTPRNTTTAGTVVDTDGRQAKIIEVAEAAIIRCVDRLRQVAPVEVIWIGGNHDYLTSYMMARTVKAFYRHDQHVSVDVSPSGRKYRLYGRTMFGYEHGDKVRDSQVRDLPALFLKEAPREWLAQAEFHEWFLAHRHSERKWTTKDTDTSLGVVTRVMHSLSATDSWHHDNKFVGNRRAAEAYWYDRDMGYKGHVLALARA